MKKLLYVPIILLLLFLILFIVGGTPFFLNFVRGKIESAVQREIGAPVHIGSLKGNIFYALEAAELDAGAAIHLTRLTASYSIFGLISREINIHNILLDGLDVDIDSLREFAQTLKKSEKGEPSRPTPFKVRIKKLSIINSKLIGAVNDKRIDLSVNLHGNVTHDAVSIDTLVFKTQSSNLSLMGTVPLNEDSAFNVIYEANLMLDEFGIEGLKGTVQSNGKLGGSVSSPRILNSTNFSIIYRDNELLGSSKLSWQQPLLDSVSLQANLTAKTIPLNKDKSNKDTWTVSLSLQQTILLCDIASSYGDVRLAGSLKGNPDNPQFVADLQGRFRYADFRPETRGRIAFKNNMLSIKNFRVSSSKVNLQGSVQLNTREPQKVDGNILIDCENLDFITNLLGSTRPVTGRLKIAAKIEGLIQNPLVKSTVECQDILAFSEQIKTANFTWTLKDSMLNLDSGIIQSARGPVDLNGWFNLRDSTFHANISSEALTLQSPEVIGEDTVPISGIIGLAAHFQGHLTNPRGEGTLQFRDFAYDTILFDDHEITFTLQDTTLDLSLSDEMKSIDLSAVASLHEPFTFHASLRLNHFDFKNYIPADTGYICAYASVRGEADQPDKIIGEVEIESLAISQGQYRIRNISPISINVRDKIAEITACTFDVQDQRVDVHGRVPLDIEQGEMDLRCKTARIDLTALTALTPVTPEVKGFLSLDIAAHGTMQNPSIDGEIRLEKIEYIMPDITVDSVYSLITFKKEYVSIEYLTGRINKGHLDIKGFARRKAQAIDTMSLDISLDKISVKSKDFGFIDVTSKLQATARKDSVKVEGEVTINKALYDVPFRLQTIVELLTKANRPPPEQNEIVKRIFCDIGISAPQGVQIANNVADVQVDVDLQIRGYLSRLNVYGTIMTPSKGTIKYLGKKFDIISAVIQFDDPYKIDPVLDLHASSFVSSIDGEFEIFMSVSGTIEKWQLELTSNPPVPEQDIISLLLIGRRRPGTYLLGDAQDIDLKGTARDYAIGLVRGTIEQTAETRLGLEKVEITGDILDPRQLDIDIEKRIGEKFTVIYGTGLESWEFRKIGLNYDITDNLSIYTLHDQENLNSSVDLDIHFKLR